ncbi:MAG TPA: phosphate ABC transporter permease subunit PstC [Xanthomonadales bacterium]|nr:phosphate ABC transporter permease subunit PstC [Xanthomonadales bacterium]
MTEPAIAAAGGVPKRRKLPGNRRWQRSRERVIEALLFASAFSAVAITAAIIAVLLIESAAFFERVSLWTFLTDVQWTPLFENPRYGILPLISGTVTTSLVALVVAIPLGTITAIYLSEFAKPRVREVVKPILELISGVPTVVFGYFALLFVTPLLQKIIPGLPGFNLLGPGIVIGIMIIPYISSLSEDAMRAVPMHLREASYGMGASRFQTAVRVVVPAATSGIVASYILAISRAVGETMVVAIAAGQQPNLTFDPTESAATITAFIVQVAMGDLPHGSVGYQSIFAAGLTLLIITLVFNLLGHWARKRFREAY